MLKSEPPSIHLFLAQLAESVAGSRPDELLSEAEIYELEQTLIPLSRVAQTHPPLASARQPSYDADMADVTREEVDAKLETIEAKMDARLATIEGKFELLFHRMDRMGQDVANFKWWLLGAVLTILFGIAGFNATLLSNMLASFESGKSTATAIVQTSEQMKQTQEQLKTLADMMRSRSDGCDDPRMIRDANGRCVLANIK